MSLKTSYEKVQIGVGLRTKHYSHLEENPETRLDFFEAISENHMYSRGRPWSILETVAKNHPLTFHGVSLSIAGHEELDKNYLEILKSMITHFNPMVVSDHLCWTGKKKNNLHNLLPFAYTEENLNFLVSRVNQVQEFLGREIALENLSAYFDFKESSMTEWEFMNELIKRSGCLMLLDINNVYVNSHNHGFDPKVFLDSVDMDRVAEIHLAGYSDMGDFYFDTHSKPVYPHVWELYRHVIKKRGDIPTLIEWDEEIPEWSELEAEAMKAKRIWEEEYL